MTGATARPHTFWAADGSATDDGLVARVTAASLDLLLTGDRHVVLLEPCRTPRSTRPVFFNQYHLDSTWLMDHRHQLWGLITATGASTNDRVETARGRCRVRVANAGACGFDVGQGWLWGSLGLVPCVLSSTKSPQPSPSVSGPGHPPLSRTGRVWGRGRAAARTLLGSPKLIILDEPTAALGIAQTAEVLDMIERLRDRGLAVIMISHNMEDVRAVADDIVVLRLGRNNGVFDGAIASTQDIVTAITGATDNVVARRAALAAHRAAAAGVADEK